MHRYSPSKEQIKREWMRYRRRNKARALEEPVIPDNSEPWLSTPPRTVGDLIAIADKVTMLEAKWRKRSNSS
jgi:hypothetical protein